MPTLGPTQADYDDLLGEVAEVMCKYNDCTVIWTGDINADPRCSLQSSNDNKFTTFCMQTSYKSLRQCQMYPRTTTLMGTADHV